MHKPQATGPKQEKSEMSAYGNWLFVWLVCRAKIVDVVFFAFIQSFSRHKNT